MFWPKPNQCNSVQRGGVTMTSVVTVTDMQGSFFILMIGCFLSCFVLAWELLYLHKKDKGEMQVKKFTP